MKVSKIIKLINDVKTTSNYSTLCIIGSQSQIKILREILGEAYHYIDISEFGGFYNLDTIYILPVEDRTDHLIRVVFEDDGENEYMDKEKEIVVYRDYSSYMNKWIAFKQEGMRPILHGRVCNYWNTCIEVRCKNAEHRFVGEKDIIKVCDTKKECYMVRNEYN